MNAVTMIIQAKRTSKTTTRQKNTVQLITHNNFLFISVGKTISLPFAHLTILFLIQSLLLSTIVGNTTQTSSAKSQQSPIPKTALPTSRHLKSTHSLHFFFPRNFNSPHPLPHFQETDQAPNGNDLGHYINSYMKCNSQ